MSDLNDLHVRRLDGTLLLVFVEAMRTRKLSIVADQLGLTASAVSHAVARLRDIFGDPLFLRRPDGIEPSERALALQGPMTAALDRFREALDGMTVFDPAKMERVFRIAGFDYAISVVATGMVERVIRHAPKTQIAFSTLGKTEALRKLEAREIDCAIGVFNESPPGYIRRVTQRETFKTVARRGHPRIGNTIDLATFLDASHLVVAASGEFRGAVDVALEKRGLKRRVVAAIPQFLGSLALVADSDMIATVPAGLAFDHARRFGLAVYDPPLEVPGFEVVILAAPGSARDRGLEWLLDIMTDKSCMLEPV